jgi:hypothetical protein
MVVSEVIPAFWERVTNPSLADSCRPFQLLSLDPGARSCLMVLMQNRCKSDGDVNG